MPIVFEKSEGGINIEFIDNNEDSFVGYYNNSNIPKSFDNDIDGFITFLMKNYFIILSGNDCFLRILCDKFNLNIKLTKRSQELEYFSKKINLIQDSFQELQEKMERFESIFSKYHQRETFNDIERKMLQEKVLKISENVVEKTDSTKKIDVLMEKVTQLTELDSKMNRFEVKLEKLSRFIENNNKITLEKKWSNLDEFNHRLDIIENTVNEIKVFYEDSDKYLRIEQRLNLIEKKFIEFSVKERRRESLHEDKTYHVRIEESRPRSEDQSDIGEMKVRYSSAPIKQLGFLSRVRKN